MNLDQNNDRLLNNLKEREKELQCLYWIEEVLKEHRLNLERMFTELVQVIPKGWQIPEHCQVRISYKGQIYESNSYEDSENFQCSSIKVNGRHVGELCVSYRPSLNKGETELFLKEEAHLISTIASRIGEVLYQKELLEGYGRRQASLSEYPHVAEWKTIVSLLKSSDRKLYIYIMRKMLHFLCLYGVNEATELLQKFESQKKQLLPSGEQNRPSQRLIIESHVKLGQTVFMIAEKYLHGDLILHQVQKWIQEEKTRFLLTVLDRMDSSMHTVIEAIHRYQEMENDGFYLPPTLNKGVSVALIRSFFSEQLEYINVAKHFMNIRDYYDIIKRIIYVPGAKGKLGGKSAGLFLAKKIIDSDGSEEFSDIKIPKTWHLASDCLMSFIYYNNLEEVFEQKYKTIDEIKVEYPNIIQIFKNSQFPPEISKSLYEAIDYFGENPIIVRSSSLLEDRFGASFSGKYKSLFLANQGTREERLEALTDCIAEIYASIFSPDPIEYRAERGLLDFHEEMGIMIQEVIGKKAGDKFFPSFSGVGFSHNEFRWSPRIKRQDGLLRLVPGLGTRAVDRISDDYPVMIAPGNPGLRVNITPDDILRYSPKYLDIIDLKENTFETVSITDLLKEDGDNYPGVMNLISKYDDGTITRPTSILSTDFEEDTLVVTFDKLVTEGRFAAKMKSLMSLLQEKMGCAVDVEFSHDGDNLYLLQCRPQGAGEDHAPAPIPTDINTDDILFRARKFISNGMIHNITHVVYVDAEAFFATENLENLKRIGKAVGKLNKILPKKQFILIGPGRWGSRGDVKLGVSVTYADINNTAALIEVAFKKGSYVPDLSFGTHFFQDLVEAGIRYIPVYPDEEEVILNLELLNGENNVMEDLLPDFADLKDTIKVLDIRSITRGMSLRIHMNGDQDEALAFFSKEKTDARTETVLSSRIKTPEEDDHWSWRFHMAEKLADEIDREALGVKAIYVLGSTKNATAGPGSDIDLMIHFDGNSDQEARLNLWLDGWSKALDEINFLRTGERAGGLLDVHIFGDEELEKPNSYTSKIGAVTDAARLLPGKTSED